VEFRVLYQAAIPPPYSAELFLKIVLPLKFRVLFQEWIPPPKIELLSKRLLPLLVKLLLLLRFRLVKDTTSAVPTL